MKQLAILCFLAAFAILSSTGFAACSSACDSGSQYSCSLTTTTMAKSTSGTLSVSVTNQQSQSQTSVATTLQDLGWFTGTTTTSTISSISSGASTSLDYTITPTSDGAQDVCVRMGSTCTADCGSITITSPASLSITSLTTSSTSVSASSAFTASATIYNSGTETAGSSTSVTATLSGSGCTVASGAKTIGTIEGKSSNSQSWTVTAGSSTCTLSLAVSGSDGGSDAASTTVSVSSGSSSNSSSSSGGGGGGGNSTSNTTSSKETKLFSTTAGVIKLLSFSQNAITDIEVKTYSAKTGVQLSVAEGSSVGTAPATVYKYLDITKSGAENSDFSLIKIRFVVPKSWFTSTGTNASTTALYRYSSGWEKLTTTQTYFDGALYYFVAESPGFSTFAIGAGAPASSSPVIGGNNNDTVTTTVPANETSSEQPTISIPSVGGSTMLTAAAVVIIIVVCYFAYRFLRGKGGKPLTKRQKYDFYKGDKKK